LKVRRLFFVLVLLLSGCGGGSCGGNSPGAGASPTGCAPTGDAYAKAVLADGPAVYYRLDEATGPSLCDASPNHNQGTYAGTGVTHGQPGALHSTSDTSIRANGTAQVATSGTDVTISGSAGFTLEGWFQTMTKQDQMVVDIGQAGPQSLAGVGPWSNRVSSTFAVTPGTGDYICLDTYDGAFEFDASAVGINVFDGSWHYAAVSYSGAGGIASVYLDKHTLGTAPVQDRPSPSPVRIGFWVDALFNKPFSGGLDEIAVYPTALSAEQIARHYAAA
jgi:hypothetical protein